MPGRTQHFYFKGAYWSLLRREFDALVGYIGRHGYVPDLEMFRAQRRNRRPDPTLRNALLLMPCGPAFCGGGGVGDRSGGG